MTTAGRPVSKFSGYAPALPTPFDDAGNIDTAAFEKFCDRQVQEGATALVVCGTTGEASTFGPPRSRRDPYQVMMGWLLPRTRRQ
jgi:4-hydroxy-tetrahydrodipicolinate synthase